MSEEFEPAFLTEDPSQSTAISTSNGLIFCGLAIPEEIVTYILSLVDVKLLLRYSLVCQMWNKLIKSYTFWSAMYRRKYNQKCKQLPWYVYYCFLTTDYFDKNIVCNENESIYKFSNCNLPIFLIFEENMYRKRKIPQSLETIPVVVLNTYLKYRATYNVDRPAEPADSYEMWLISFSTNKLFLHIIDKFKPHIRIGNCGAIYELQCGIFKKELDRECAYINTRCGTALQRAGIRSQRIKYEKVELLINEYPQGTRGVVIESRHFSNIETSLSNASVVFIFESINELGADVENATAIDKINCNWKSLGLQ